jgi:POT family proton-dependent oligopeptide transporter
MVNKLAPVKLASLLMGVWFLSTAAANKFAGTLSALYPEEIRAEKLYAPTADAAAMAVLNVNMLDNNVWTADPKGTTNLKIASVTTTKSSDGTEVVNNIVVDSTKIAPVSNYYLKVIKSNNGNFDRALLLNENLLITHDSVDVVTMVNDKKVSRKEERIQTWNLKLERPSFMGVKINDLYDFFMLFVFMAGAASVILFLLSSKLLKMMNGVR